MSSPGASSTGVTPKVSYTGTDAVVCLVGIRCATLDAVKHCDWGDTKNAKLRAQRGLGFEDNVFASRSSVAILLDILSPPDPKR